MVYERILSVCDLAGAYDWMCSPNSELGGARPLDLMDTDPGLDAVLAYLDDIEDVYLSEKRLKNIRNGNSKPIPLNDLMKRKTNEKVEHELFNLTVFFLKVATKLTLDETIRKAKMLISQIEADIKPSKDLANRLLTRHNKHLAALITVQKRSIEVFDRTELAEGWLKSPVPALGGDIPMELMITDKGIEMVLNELGRIEHGLVF